MSGDELTERCRKRLARIEKDRDEGIYARAYKEDIEAMLCTTSFDAYQQAAARTLGDQRGLAMVALGLSGEAGECVDLIKKHLYHGHDLDPGKLTQEIGDVLWYCAALATVTGIRLHDVADKNIAKLRARYPDGFSVEASRNRSEANSAAVVDVVLGPPDETGLIQAAVGDGRPVYRRGETRAIETALCSSSHTLAEMLYRHGELHMRVGDGDCSGYQEDT